MVSSAVNPKQQQLIYNNNGNTNQTGVSQEQGSKIYFVVDLWAK